MDSFVVAVVAVSRPVAQLVEVDAFFCPDALYVVEGTSDHHLLCTWGKEQEWTVSGIFICFQR